MRRRWRRGVAGGVLAAALVAGLAGCGSVGYLAQSAKGHLSLMHAAKPVDDWIADPATPASLRERLELTQRIRSFSVDELHLPDNDSYRRYADLKRSAVVWNVVAAPELSLTLRTRCFPIVGCVGYQGFFDRADADKAAGALRAEGYEVSVYGVPAYSTLGWSNWIGGDPLLSTFIRYPEGELSRMIFHELAHQVAYAAGDTGFNESFATAVETIGGERWLTERSTPAVREEYERYDQRRRDFREITQRYRDRFETLYASDRPDADKRTDKARLLAEMRAEYTRLKVQRWGGYTGYDRWFETANNASLGVISAYNDLVPQFQALFRREGDDFPRFYAEVKRLAKLPRPERRAALAALVPAAAAATNVRPPAH